MNPGNKAGSRIWGTNEKRWTRDDCPAETGLGRRKKIQINTSADERIPRISREKRTS